MIKYNNSTINDWNFDDSNIKKVYYNNDVCYQKITNETPTPPPTPIDYGNEYLTFVAQTDNVTFSLYGGNSSNVFQYSLDNGSTWNNLQIGQTSPSINNGDKIYWKASGLTINSELGIGTIRPSASATVEGNIMSIIYSDNFSGQTEIPSNFQLRKLFSGATNITSAENLVLPATTVKKQCYSQMFQGCNKLVKAPKTIGSTAMTWSGDYIMSDMFHGCTELTTAPELLSLTLGTQCYWSMFEGCTSLTTSPILSASTLATQCYQGMFSGCTSLNTITCLATNPSTNFTTVWASNVSSSGTFYKHPNANWPTGNNGIPNNWTVQDYQT